jgi:hypothetical protein
LVSLAIVLLIIDIIWPNVGIGIVNNIGGMVDGMSRDGLTGVIALVLFLMLYKGGSKTAEPASPSSTSDY